MGQKNSQGTFQNTTKNGRGSLIRFVLLTTLKGIFLFSIKSQAALTYPVNNPDNGEGATEFNWQVEWGSIHINSYADGLADPGTPSTSTGKMPCLSGDICGAFGNPDAVRSEALDNGIKFDIKNSLLNCMSRPMPTWATKHSEAYSDNNVCIGGIHPRLGDPHTLVYMPLYDPRSNDDHDELSGSNKTGCQQQIINNCARDIHECKNNVSDTINDGPGYLNPVTHVFSAQEVEDLGGAGTRLPTTYYSYEKIVTKGSAVTNSHTPPSGNYIDQGDGEPYDCSYWGDVEKTSQLKTECVSSDTVKASCAPDPVISPVPSPAPPPPDICECSKSNRIEKKCKTYNYTPITAHRQALSASANPSDKVPQLPVTTIEKITDSNLARLKSFKITNSVFDAEGTSFIIVDPSDFFDLRHYINGGKYDSDYNKFTGDGLVETYDTCPVLGLNNGYGGICDPTGKSGCNLPIYGVGPETSFTDAAGKSFTFNAYHIKWSGYVKKWAFITPTQYWDNVKERKNVGGGYLYLKPEKLNSNPVLMITRADEYCEFNERYSGQLKINIPPAVPLPPDLPCIQYLQYQANSDESFSFTDLFSPEEEPPLGAKISYTIKQNFHIKENGKPDPSKPVAGTGTDQDIGGDGSQTGYVSFLDVTTPTSVYDDLSKPLTNIPAIKNQNYKGPLTFAENGEYVSGPVLNTSGSLAAGLFLGWDATAGTTDMTKGVGIYLEPGTSVAVRMPQSVDVEVSDGSIAHSSCIIATLDPSDSEYQIFIPTNTPEEYQSFVAAMSNNSSSISELRVRKCAGKYETYADATSTGPGQNTEGPVENPNGTETWLGKIDCNKLTVRPSCNQTKLITAQRYCQLENGSFGNCEECDGANDPDAGIDFTDDLVHGHLMANPYSGNASRCYFSAACFNNQAGGCPSASTITGHVFCLAGETKIMMANGLEKAIASIKAGDEVIAFEAKHSKSGVMKKAKVKATAITQKQKTLIINDLKITPLHKVVLASGRAVMAKDLKVGDKILKENGLFVTVNKIEKNQPPITVYNLVLEDGADGYIANGLRVLSYPIPNGMVP